MCTYIHIHEQTYQTVEGFCLQVISDASIVLVSRDLQSLALANA